MTARGIRGWTIVALWLLSVPVGAVEYRLQVTNISDRNFNANFDRSNANPRGQETMQGLEARLDAMEFSTAAVLPGRELRLLDNPAFGGKVPDRVSFLPATRDQETAGVRWVEISARAFWHRAAMLTTVVGHQACSNRLQPVRSSCDVRFSQATYSLSVFSTWERPEAIEPAEAGYYELR